MDSFPEWVPTGAGEGTNIGLPAKYWVIPTTCRGVGGPRRDRTGDLLIANEPEGESEKVSEGPSGPQERKDDENDTG